MFTACGAGTSGTAPADYGTSQAASTSPSDVYPGYAVPEYAVSDATQGTVAGSGAAGSSAVANRKITFSASFTISTKNYDQDYAEINRLVAESDGYIANENSYTPRTYDGRTSTRSSSFSLKIPIGAYNSFLTALEGVGDVTNKNKSSEDLTAHYFDTESRIELLELRRDRLMQYLVTAEKASDIVEFERELSDVLYELDQYQGEKRRLDQLVEYASIDVDLKEAITPETIGADGKPLGDQAGNAFFLSLQGVKTFLGNVVIFFAAAAPVLVLLAVIGILIWLFVKLMLFIHRKRKASRREKAQANGQANRPNYPNQPIYPSQPNNAHYQNPQGPPNQQGPNHPDK
jgi:hypothetical protein